MVIAWSRESTVPDFHGNSGVRVAHHLGNPGGIERPEAVRAGAWVTALDLHVPLLSILSSRVMHQPCKRTTKERLLPRAADPLGHVFFPARYGSPVAKTVPSSPRVGTDVASSRIIRNSRRTAPPSMSADPRDAARMSRRRAILSGRIPDLPWRRDDDPRVARSRAYTAAAKVCRPPHVEAGKRWRLSGTWRMVAQGRV